MDLFEKAAHDDAAQRAPLAERMRPRTLDELVGQEHLLGEGHLLREAIAYCESVRDYVSREIFEDILESEEEHLDWLETQLELIEKIGVQNYLQSQL